MSSPPPAGYYGPVDPFDPSALETNPFEGDGGNRGTHDDKRHGKKKKATFWKRASSYGLHGPAEARDAPFGGVPVNESEAMAGYAITYVDGVVGEKIRVDNVSFPVKEVEALKVGVHARDAIAHRRTRRRL